MTYRPTTSHGLPANGLSIGWGGLDSNQRPGDYERFSAPMVGGCEAGSNPLYALDATPKLIGANADGFRLKPERRYDGSVT